MQFATTNMPGFTASDVTFTPNQIKVNWQNLPYDTSTVVKLDINDANPTPEPGFVWCGLLVPGCRKVAWVRQNRRAALSARPAL